VDPAKERKRLGKQQKVLEKEVAGLEKRLASSNFAAKASPEVVAATTAGLTEKMEALAGVRRGLEELEGK